MGGHRNVLEMSTIGEGASTTSTLASSFTSEPIWAFFYPLIPCCSSSHRFNSSTMGFFTMLSRAPGCDDSFLGNADIEMALLLGRSNLGFRKH